MVSYRTKEQLRRVSRLTGGMPPGWITQEAVCARCRDVGLDISEFESSHPSHAVPSLWAMSGLRNYAQQRPGRMPGESLSCFFLCFR
jgi:hypothetical protein